MVLTSPRGAVSVQTTFMYCKPYLMNAPASDLLGLFEQLVTTKAAAGLAQQQPSHPQPPAPMHLCLLDYCRSKGKGPGQSRTFCAADRAATDRTMHRTLSHTHTGWRIAPRQRALLQLDFGSW